MVAAPPVGDSKAIPTYFLPPSFPQEHRTEIDARYGTFQAFEQFGQQLLVRGHYASSDIQQRLEALEQQRADLEKAWVQRRMMLDQCLELQVHIHTPQINSIQLNTIRHNSTPFNSINLNSVRLNLNPHN